MKMFIAGVLQKLSKSPKAQKFLDGSLVKAAHYYQRNRQANFTGPGAEQYAALYHELQKELTVRSGPFKGMKYSQAEAAGSALIPKLLGSYECELHPIIERLIEKGYDDVIDVGCAEGYYATGMTLRLPLARIHAYDTNEKARALCSAMTKLNGVADRVSIQTTCTPETLITFPKPGRTLVIVDCESYEKVLFTPAVRDALKGCDVLIEMHDFLDVTISTELEALFAATHQLTNVLSTDDIQKARHYQYPELIGLPVRARFQLLAEGRPMIMEWLLAEAR